MNAAHPSKRYLVTGGSGFIGRHLVKRLGTEGVDQLHHGQDPSRFRADYDCVFHLAAEIRQPALMFESNVALTHRLVSTLSYRKFIHVGSSSEYGRQLHPTRETDRPSPRNLYEGTKAAASMIALGYASEHHKDICVVRPYSVYGPGDHPARFVPAVMRSLRTGQPMTVTPGAHDWTYIDDLIDALLTLSVAQPELTAGDIVNLGTGVQVTNRQLVQCAQCIAGRTFPITELPDARANDSDCWVCDPTYAANRYGIRCLTSLHEGLSMVYQLD